MSKPGTPNIGLKPGTPGSVGQGVGTATPGSRLATPPASLHLPPDPWSSSVFSCHQDPGSCCWTLVCPAATFATIANAVDNTAGCKGKCHMYLLKQLCCVCAFYSFQDRTKIRAKYNLLEEPFSDFMTHCLLSQCALCQEYRELKIRGVELGCRKPPRPQIMKK